MPDDLDNLDNLDNFRKLQGKLGGPTSIVELVPTKSDKEIADELRQKLIDVYQPVLDALTEAKRKGFDVSVTTGADGFSIVRLMNIQIVKQF